MTTALSLATWPSCGRPGALGCKDRQLGPQRLGHWAADPQPTRTRPRRPL